MILECGYGSNYYGSSVAGDTRRHATVHERWNQARHGQRNITEILPPEIIVQCFMWLSTSDRMKATEVSRAWRKIVVNSPMVWSNATITKLVHLKLVRARHGTTPVTWSFSDHVLQQIRSCEIWRPMDPPHDMERTTRQLRGKSRRCSEPRISSAPSTDPFWPTLGNQTPVKLAAAVAGACSCPTRLACPNI
ncbi:hypothetical protein BKA62DRAFT_286309 [Auriculariales sp. MPI-PUGE-AT-0066]|nr:hypothetical protein BKA62DRAFT_286309 [Auriculariales sp. MPI-PUGE-AT-0066]